MGSSPRLGWGKEEVWCWWKQENEWAAPDHVVLHQAYVNRKNQAFYTPGSTVQPKPHVLVVLARWYLLVPL